MSLNAATTNSLTSSADEYVSMSDGAEVQRFTGGIGDELTQDDIDAFGSAFFEDAENR